MPDDESPREQPSSAPGAPAAPQAAVGRRVPAYLLSLLVLFAAPVALLWGVIMRSVQKKPFFLSVGIISAVGWAWSITVTSHRWWEFPAHFLAGIYVAPNLPIEEFLFYPFGGILSVFLYAYCGPKVKSFASPIPYWFYLVLGACAFGFLAFWRRAYGPYYLYSQLIVFNGLSLLCAPMAAREMNLPALGAPVAALGLTGFLWDYVAFKYHWWIYNAITQIRISLVPIDDFNFFFFAPAAAVSIYLVCCRFFRLSQFPSTDIP